MPFLQTLFSIFETSDIFHALTSVAIGKQNTKPRRQLIKISEDSNCKKCSGRIAMSPLEIVLNRAMCCPSPKTIMLK